MKYHMRIERGFSDFNRYSTISKLELFFVALGPVFW